MSEQNTGKINLLHQLLEEGMLASTWWLDEHGFSRSLLAKYEASGWLASPARGVYRRPGPPLKWQHLVASLQLLEGSFAHVGGRTALVHRGLGHYVQMSGPETIALYGPDTLPAWANKLKLPEHFAMRRDVMFAGLRARRMKDGSLVNHDGKPFKAKRLEDFGLRESPWGAWDWPLIYSTDERAVLEVLQHVPDQESVYEADVLMQGLAGLRPARMMQMLQACASVKVKRLFFALAERHQHAWFKHLDAAKVDLGSGKRMLAPGGKLHPVYLITLPADLDVHTR